MQTDPNDIASQKISDYVMTAQFERPMSPLYGANSQYLVFENYDSLVFEEYKMETIQELNRVVTGASIIDIRLLGQGPFSNPDTYENAVTVAVQFKTPTGGTQTTQLDLVSPLSLNEDTPL